MITTKKRIIRTYSELITFKTFEERFNYLKLDGIVGRQTFGYDRWLNQDFYRSDEWKDVRREVIIRDNGCDLGVEDYDIQGIIIVHHMNPINVEDIVNVTEYLLNPDYLISSSSNTHKAIHYGDPELLKLAPVYFAERKPYDTCLWKGGLM